MNPAEEWIKTDEEACYGDVMRLGIDEAVDYTLELMWDRHCAGDLRWDQATSDQIRAALEALVKSRQGEQEPLRNTINRLTGSMEKAINWLDMNAPGRAREELLEALKQ